VDLPPLLQLRSGWVFPAIGKDTMYACKGARSRAATQYAGSNLGPSVVTIIVSVY
jgi:hypothetical protein